MCRGGFDPHYDSLLVTSFPLRNPRTSLVFSFPSARMRKPISTPASRCLPPLTSLLDREGSLHPRISTSSQFRRNVDLLWDDYPFTSTSPAILDFSRPFPPRSSGTGSNFGGSVVPLGESGAWVYRLPFFPFFTGACFSFSARAFTLVSLLPRCPFGQIQSQKFFFFFPCSCPFFLPCCHSLPPKSIQGGVLPFSLEYSSRNDRRMYFVPVIFSSAGGTRRSMCVFSSSCQIRWDRSACYSA